MSKELMTLAVGGMVLALLFKHSNDRNFPLIVFDATTYLPASVPRPFLGVLCAEVSEKIVFQRKDKGAHYEKV